MTEAVNQGKEENYGSTSSIKRKGSLGAEGNRSSAVDKRHTGHSSGGI